MIEEVAEKEIGKCKCGSLEEVKEMERLTKENCKGCTFLEENN